MRIAAAALVTLGFFALAVVVTPSDGTGPLLLRISHQAFVEGDALMLDGLLRWGLWNLVGALAVVLAGFPILWVAPRLAGAIRKAARGA